MSETFYVSRKSYEKLRQDLEDLKKLKTQLSEEIGEAARQGAGGETPTAHDVIRGESESFLASIGGYPNGERVEIALYLPNGWRP